MTYETMDWDAEAKRVARAFGTKNEWAFNGNPAGGSCWLNVPLEGYFYNGSRFGYGALFIAPYNSMNRQFRLEQKVDGLLQGVHISLDWHGALEYDRVDWKIESIAHLTNSLARVLFHLDLLTPEIEAALKVSISAHERLEWTLEYEAQSDL